MTPKFTTEAFAVLGAPHLVYVRPIKAGELLADSAVEIAQGFPVPPDQTLYAVHGANGQRLAVAMDRASAIGTALANDLAVVALN